jgi:4-hydroxy-3-polyprenylbenzoate decarboxylase
VIVTDDDVDVTNLEQLIWAVAMRTDPKHSIQFIDGSWDSPADPALSPQKREAGDFTHSVAIINACKPYHWRDNFAAVEITSLERTRRLRHRRPRKIRLRLRYELHSQLVAARRRRLHRHTFTLSVGCG